MTDWELERREGYHDFYYKVKKFNGTDYKIEIQAEDNIKSVRFWVAVSSGNKRKALKVFAKNDAKRIGGLPAFMWVKEQMLSFPKYFINLKKIKKEKVYLCVGWADNRRRDIYYRSLSREGFRYANIDGEKVLMKRIQ